MFNVSNMIGVRIDTELEHRLADAARREGRSKSAIVREAIRRYLTATDLAEEARTQSLSVSGDAAEREAARFVEEAVDLDEAD